MNKKEELLLMTLFAEDTTVYWRGPEDDESEDWVDETDDDEDDDEVDFSSDSE